MQSTRILKKRRVAGVPWYFLAPALLAYILVVVYPIVAGGSYAFTDWNGLNPVKTFVGLENFRRLLQDDQALSSLKNTVLITLSVTLVQNTLGLLLALGANSTIRTRFLLRTVLFAPAVISSLVAAYLWQYLYDPNVEGGINALLTDVGLKSLRQDWLGNPQLALFAITGTVVWQYTGYSMVIFLAGLQGVPVELYEAAELDGAGAWQSFWNVTRPMIAPAITVNLMLSVIGGFKLFDQILAMTGGGPGYATSTLSLLMYKQAFVFSRFGYSTATALVLAIIIAGVSLLQLKLLRSQELEG